MQANNLKRIKRKNNAQECYSIAIFSNTIGLVLGLVLGVVLGVVWLTPCGWCQAKSEHHMSGVMGGVRGGEGYTLLWCLV